MTNHECMDTIRGSDPILSWEQWLADGKALLAVEWRAFVRAVKTCERMERERAYLLDMDERILRDVGMTREDAVQQAKKRAWRR